MLNRILLCTALVVSLACADTLTLRDGRTVQGTFIGGTARQIRMAVEDRVDSFDINEVSELKFGTGRNATRAEAPRAAEPAPRAEFQRQQEPQAPAPVLRRAAIEIPSGTSVVIRMIDDVD